MSDATSSGLRYQYKTFLDQLPADWKKKPITQIGKVVGGGTPSREVPSFWRGPIPWVTPGEVSSEVSKYLHDTNDHISAAGLAGSGANVLPIGSLMVTTRATLGARVINAVPMATNQGFKSIAFRQANDADYYFHLLEKVKPELVRRASGTTFLEISGAEFGGIVVPSPSTPEKKEISQVLDTLDTAIRETESIISKLNAVKRGLQDDLLTRGLDANGELRRSQSEAPHLYKESLLGWIPREWEPVQLGQLLRELGQGWSPDCPPEPASANEWGVLKTTSIVWDGYNENENKRLPNGFKSRTSLEVAADDILITRAGPKTRVGVVVHVVSTRPGLLISDKMYRLRMLDTEIAAYFGLAMSANYAQAAISRTVSGMAESQTNISQGVIKSLLVLRPPRDEQSAIVVRSRSIDERLNCEVMQFGKLRQHKKALMDDLLTGRVRVAPLLEQAEQRALEGSA